MVDLSVFCGPHPGARYDTEEPFVVGVWRWATNGSIMVRVPAGGADPTRGRRLPDVAAFVRLWADSFRRVDKRRAWPPFDKDGTEYLCRRCWGHGKDIEECEACGGGGWAGINPCPVCRGDGTIAKDKTVCSHCCGAGRLRLQTVGGATIDEHYWRLISRLPGVYWIETARKQGDPVLFGWTDDGGGDGLVMPMEPPDMRTQKGACNDGES